MSARGTIWNGIEPVTSLHKKRLIRLYCVYNIISLQNITLKIPIATKNSILDVGKVSQNQLCFAYTLNWKSQQPSMKIRLVPNY